MTNSDLRERAEKIIRLMEAADDLKTEIKDRYDDAKNAGYTVSALKKAIKRYCMDADKRAKQVKRAKQESEQLDFETYLAEMEGGLNKPRLRQIMAHGDAVVAKFKADHDAT